MAGALADILTGALAGVHSGSRKQIECTARQPQLRHTRTRHLKVNECGAKATHSVLTTPKCTPQSTNTNASRMQSDANDGANTRRAASAAAAIRFQTRCFVTLATYRTRVDL